MSSNENIPEVELITPEAVEVAALAADYIDELREHIPADIQPLADTATTEDFHALRTALNRYIAAQRSIASDTVDDMLLSALKIKEAFEMAAAHVFAEYGLDFAPSYETSPGKLSLSGWQNLKLTMGYLTTREQARNAAEQEQLAEQVRRNQQKRDADAGTIKPYAPKEPGSTVLTGNAPPK